MRDPYGVIFHRFWEGPTGRQIQAKGCEAVILAAYLVSCRHANMIGLYEMPIIFVERDLPVLRNQAAILSAFAALEAVDFAQYDPASEHVWVREMARIRAGLAPLEPINTGDNKYKAIVRLYASVRPNPFLGPFHQYYRTTLRLQEARTGPERQQVFNSISTANKPLPVAGEAPCKPVAVQDQEQISGSGNTAASPREHAREPNQNGNYRVIHRLAVELLTKQSFESESEFRGAVKDACAAHGIDYGDHPNVEIDVIRRACAAALSRHGGKSRRLKGIPA